MVKRNRFLTCFLACLFVPSTIWTMQSCVPVPTNSGITPVTAVPPTFLSFRLNSPYSIGMYQYKGQVHAHSTIANDDGDSSPHDVLSYYQGLGYKFVALTGHNTNCAAIWGNPGVQGITFISGKEDGRKYDTHLIEFGLTRHDEPCGSSDNWAEQTRINYIHDQGGISVLAHPFWKDDSWGPELEANPCALYNYDGIEIANKDDKLGGNQRSIALWDRLLAAGWKVWGFAVDDEHYLRPSDVNHGYILVNSDKQNVQAQDIVDNIKNGNFFAISRSDTPNPDAPAEDSEPSIYVGVSGNRILVVTDQLDHVVRFMGQYGQLAEYGGANTAVFYDANGSEGYIRIEAELKRANATYFIYSQPIFVVDADPNNQGAQGIVHQRLSGTVLTFDPLGVCRSPISAPLSGNGKFQVTVPAGSYEYIASDGYYQAKGQVTIPQQGFVDLDIRMELKPGTREAP